MNDSKIVSFVTERIQDWETGMSQFFGHWNEWMASYQMKFIDKEPRPDGVAKNVVAETPRAVNTLATSITRMQTASDPSFELRAKPNSGVQEAQVYDMEATLQDILVRTEYKRYLLKGNRGMCLFGTQVWEKPLISYPIGSAQPIFEGTALRPLSLLQVAFNTTVYDMEFSDHLSPVIKIGSHALRNLAYGREGVWDLAKIEQAIKEESQGAGDTGQARASIDERRQRAGYNELKERQHELILYNGRVTKEITELPEFAEMWTKYGRADNPLLTDITIGILNRKHIVRFHPTAYGTWHHLFNIGHYIEIELEPIAHGVGSLGSGLQKDINRIMRNAHNVAKFSLFNMMLAGRGSGLKSNNMNVYPFSAIPVDDVNQVKPLQPSVEGINYGIKLLEKIIEDFRTVTHATTTLQAVVTGATATESSLAQNEALRAISLCAEVNGDSVIRPYLETVITNLIDQNPYDTRFVPVTVVPKITTDKDYKPEQAKKLLEFLNVVTTIRNTMPLDFNAMPILEYLGRSVGINPREFKQPRPQADRLLDVMRRLSNNGSAPGNEAAGEAASAGAPDGNVSDVAGMVPTSPAGVQ